MTIGSPLTEEILKIATEGFDEGYSAAVDMLTDPMVAQWLAETTGLPVERAEAVLAELRDAMVGARDKSWPRPAVQGGDR